MKIIMISLQPADWIPAIDKSLVMIELLRNRQKAALGIFFATGKILRGKLYLKLRYL